HRAQIQPSDAARHALGIDYRRQKLPAFEFANLAVRLVTAYLLVERVKQLLAGGGAGKCSAVIERAAEAPEIEQTFRCAIERNTHAVEQIDDCRRRFAHAFDRRLVSEEIASIDGVVKVLPGSVAFALQVLGGIDAALGANRMRTLDGNDGEQVHRSAGFGDLDDGRKSGQAAANHDDFWCCHVVLIKIPVQGSGSV